METYTTDQDQVEALKKWWKENGKAVVAGVVIGTAGVVGWRGWQHYQESRALRASASYEQLLSALPSAPIETLERQAQQLTKEYRATPYASLAELALAKRQLESGDRKGAEASLMQVIDWGPQPGLQQIAKLRLARLYLQGGEVGRAEQLIAGAEPGAFAAMFDELQGDIYLAKGQTEEARSAYQKALLGGVPDPELLRTKIDDLGVSASSEPVS